MRHLQTSFVHIFRHFEKEKKIASKLKEVLSVIIYKIWKNLKYKGIIGDNRDNMDNMGGS